jgi:hypothetical protein
VQFAESKPTFRKHISPPSSGSKNKPRKKPAGTRQRAMFYSGFFLGLFFDFEDGGDMFLGNFY